MIRPGASLTNLRCTPFVGPCGIKFDLGPIVSFPKNRRPPALLLPWRPRAAAAVVAATRGRQRNARQSQTGAAGQERTASLSGADGPVRAGVTDLLLGDLDVV